MSPSRGMASSRRSAKASPTTSSNGRGGIDKGLLKGYSAEDVARYIRQAKNGPGPIILKPVISKQNVFGSWRAHMDRFLVVSTFQEPVREGYLENVEQTFEKGASGIIVFPLFYGLLFDHPAYMAVYELCRKHKKSIVVRGLVLSPHEGAEILD